MWHESFAAATGNIFRQPQIILHVCVRTLTSGSGRVVVGNGGSASNWGSLGSAMHSLHSRDSGGYYNICLFVDIKMQFMQRHYYQSLSCAWDGKPSVCG